MSRIWCEDSDLIGSDSDASGDRESGSILVIVAMLGVVLLGFAGLTIDYGYYFSQKTRLQAEADAAAVACGLTARCKPGAMLAPENAAVFNPLGFSANDVKVLAINARCPHNPALNNCIEVEAMSTWDTFFVRLFNVSTLTASATAVAVGGQTPQPVVVPSVLATGTGREGIQSHGNAADAVRVRGDIVSNSGIQVNNNSAITLLDGGIARAVGGITGAINGNQEPLKTAMADPCSALPSPTVPAEKSCKPLPEITGSSCGRT
ncbi:TadE/TadG family type IV pilus assembly protein [Orrella marina]|uniref:Putative Flp pilus-assembly TadG-like N-terminal domain-containing protein n=1 Tax=Orrella marina TaxID=2163011 RepID=A0A2R4XF93_9BURK|nr:Tad domain-containing protein [Orrella marina]AWB32464.1 hypothetical protein DBV39_00640 [Orrella marina]